MRVPASVASALCVAVSFASSSLAAASAPTLTLEPTVATLDDAPARTPLMSGLDRLGAGKSLDDLKINIYGWVEAGYYANLRNNNHSVAGPGIGPVPSHPHPFTDGYGNHAMLNQIDLRFERQVDSKTFDVGGMVELLYGTDSNYIKSNGILYQTAGDNPGEVPQFEIPQAYIDVNLPVGNGLKIRAGKFVTLLGNETIAPTTNALYSHSYIFNSLPFTQTGVLAFYTLNDQWSVIGGFTRGWDQSTEDNGVCAVDFLGQVTYAPSKQLSFILTTSVGPQNFADSSHYRTVIDPIATWQVTDRLSLTVEGLYVYDGGINVEENDSTHAYGDVWGAAVYAKYVINEYFTFNARFEKLHSYQDVFFGDASDFLGTDPQVPTVNLYEVTLGLTIIPMPKDALWSNLSIRPEVRYDWSEDQVFTAGHKDFQDRFSAGVDVIFKF